jgi:signal peptidase
MAGIAGRLACTVGVAALLGALLLSVGTALLPLAGYQTTEISGGSMEPAIHRGSLVISRPVSPDGLQAGDIVTFRRTEEQASVTHRIVAVHEIDGKLAFTMKGDANDAPDPNDVSFSVDTPRVVLSVPYAGYALVFLHSARGMFLVTVLPAIGLAMLFVLGIGKPNAEEAPSRA